MSESKAYTPRDVLDDDRLRAMQKAYEEHYSVFPMIEHIKNQGHADWFSVSVDVFGAEAVATYMAYKAREKRES